MPELPEVELARRNLRRWFEGRRVVKTAAENSRVFRGSSPKAFATIRGKLVRADRKGKYLLLEFERGGALAHLGMTGKLVRRPSGERVKHSRAQFRLDSGEVVHFQDPRMFGRIEVLDRPDLESNATTAALGPDLLNDRVSWKTLKSRVGSSRQDLKVALLDQTRIAGLGNIHAAEALFRAKLHPKRKPASLTDAEWRALSRGIRSAIAFALKQEEGDDIVYVEEPGATNPFRIYGRAGEPCLVCGTTVKSFTQGGRTTHACPQCQPETGARR